MPGQAEQKDIGTGTNSNVLIPVPSGSKPTFMSANLALNSTGPVYVAMYIGTPNRTPVRAIAAKNGWVRNDGLNLGSGAMNLHIPAGSIGKQDGSDWFAVYQVRNDTGSTQTVSCQVAWE